MSYHKTGYVAILGLPNSGKSTLLNALLGQKLSIITSKPQTTRKRILGILSEESYQIIFLDTPGILSPSYLLQEKMMEEVKSSLDDADVIILIIDANEDPFAQSLLNQEFVKEKVFKSKKSKLLVLNKIDLIKQEKVTELIKHFEEQKLFEEVIPILDPGPGTCHIQFYSFGIPVCKCESPGFKITLIHLDSPTSILSSSEI